MNSYGSGSTSKMPNPPRNSVLPPRGFQAKPRRGSKFRSVGFANNGPVPLHPACATPQTGNWSLKLRSHGVKPCASVGTVNHFVAQAGIQRQGLLQPDIVLHIGAEYASHAMPISGRCRETFPANTGAAGWSGIPPGNRNGMTPLTLPVDRDGCPASAPLRLQTVTVWRPMRPDRVIACLEGVPEDGACRGKQILQGRRAPEIGQPRNALDAARESSRHECEGMIGHDGIQHTGYLPDDCHCAVESNLDGIQEIGGEDVLFMNRLRPGGSKRRPKTVRRMFPAARFSKCRACR